MKTLLAILLSLALVGCSTVVPVKAKFPDAPDTIKRKCPALKPLQDDAKLSDIAKTVAENYTTYHECSVNNDAWIEWYDTQKRIFETVK